MKLSQSVLLIAFVFGVHSSAWCLNEVSLLPGQLFIHSQTTIGIVQCIDAHRNSEYDRMVRLRNSLYNDRIVYVEPGEVRVIGGGVYETLVRCGRQAASQIWFRVTCSPQENPWRSVLSRSTDQWHRITEQQSHELASAVARADKQEVSRLLSGRACPTGLFLHFPMTFDVN